MPNGEWKVFHAVLRAESPIHIGWHRLGLIERTRYYIPGRSIWGMLVAGIARARYSSMGVPKMYKTAEGMADVNLRFTCFFPGDCEDGSVLWRPSYDDESGSLLYGSAPAASLETRLVYSQASTAIAALGGTAEDGSLHETEFLTHEWRDSGIRKRLTFSGYIFHRGPVTKELLGDVLRRMQVGGELRYGWGQLCCTHLEEHSSPLFNEFQYESFQNTIRLRARCKFSLPGHLVCERGQNLQGDVEVVGGRMWGSAGSGRYMPSRARLCWAPGTLGNLDSPNVFEIGPQGFWKAV